MTQTIDDVPSCGQENDYRRARSSADSASAWCQPMDNGKHTSRKFMLYFEDRDQQIVVFEDEAEARAAFEKADTNWNCYLFGALSRDPAQPSQELADQLAKEQRIGMGMAKTLERSMAINRDLRKALEEAAQRLEARGHNFGASEARRVLRET